MKNKRGQFYLVAVLFIVTIFIGLITVENFAEVENNVVSKNLERELSIEKMNVLDYLASSGLSDVDSTAILVNFSKTYINKIGTNKNILFIVGKDNGGKIIGNSLNDSKLSYNVGAGNVKIDKDGGFEIDFTPAITSIDIFIDQNNYTFNLEKGQNLYYIIKHEYNNEVHIVRSEIATDKSSGVPEKEVPKKETPKEPSLDPNILSELKTIFDDKLISFKSQMDSIDAPISKVFAVKDKITLLMYKSLLIQESLRENRSIVFFLPYESGGVETMRIIHSRGYYYLDYINNIPQLPVSVFVKRNDDTIGSFDTKYYPSDRPWTNTIYNVSETFGVRYGEPLQEYEVPIQPNKNIYYWVGDYIDGEWSIITG